MEQKINVICDVKIQLETKQFRGIKNVMRTLCLGILYFNEHDKFVLHKPGAAHSARWMAHIFYAQKMFMCHKQLKYDEDAVDGLRRSLMFG